MSLIHRRIENFEKVALDAEEYAASNQLDKA